MCNIYKLTNPQTNEVVYIGSTYDRIENRLSGHYCNMKSANSPIYTYMRFWHEKGIKMEISLIEVCEDRGREIFWIHEYLKTSPLLNKALASKDCPSYKSMVRNKAA